MTKPTKAPNGTTYERTCERCGEVFILRSKQKAAKQKFCSMACKIEASRKPRAEKKRYQPAPLGVPRPCELCGADFQPRKYAHVQRFCSQACALRNAQKIYSQRSGAEDRQCEVCGATFRHRSTGNAGRFCSRACMYEGMSGAKSPAYKGGRSIKKDGYVLVLAPDHPRAHGKGGYIAEHIYVMEQYLGRPLVKGETPHHKNGQRDDNRIENLELWAVPQPRGQRAVDLLAYGRELVARYEPIEHLLA